MNKLARFRSLNAAQRLMIVFALGALGFTLAACSLSIAGHRVIGSEPAQQAPQAGPVSANVDADGVYDAYEAHAMLFEETDFPSAFTCQPCHEDHFREWSVSQHAYAQLSPVFNAMQATITKRTNGTNGDFCIRCHTQVGMNLGEPVHMSNMDRAQVSREGVTCITCHRVSGDFGTVSGRLAIHKGPLTDSVKGPTGGAGLEPVLADKMRNRVVTEPDEVGRKIHGEAEKFFAITTPEFCGSCHDVTLFNGFRLEEAFTEYKHSIAADAGHTCQDCHMGLEPGKPSGYREGHAAVVAGQPTRKRKLTNHYFAGPDHSVIHPLLFPFNADVYQRWTMRQMITFDWKA
ncbi:MAG: hypothetical protein KDB07_08625, partial [Planctomycetes bacterium]|nr:hypothetical protein [Planctomycetota bacterium]